MKLLNIHNTKRTIHLFTRNDKGELSINRDNSFYPYYYEPDQNAKYETYDNMKVKKIICSEPREVGQKRSMNSYEADILFPKRYIIDKIDKFDKCPIKYFFIDIEVLADEIPNIQEAKYPISCISIYHSQLDAIHTWWLPSYKNEEEMLEDFIKYIKNQKPDLLLAWNINFDYTYLYNRIEDFPKKISPINQVRYGQQDMFYPAGISLLDYMVLFKKIYNREPSNKLDDIAEKYLGKGKKHKDVDFSTLNPEIKERNIEDVELMVKLEEKFKFIDYYDEIRRFSQCLWEDLIANSRVLDIVILKEAKKRNIILSNRSKQQSYDELQGAYRRADIGVFNDIYKADVASMYPNQIINFCLDAQNITSHSVVKRLKFQEANKNIISINNINFIQNSDALLPSVSKDLIEQKNSIKTELKNLDVENKEYENLKHKYDAIKSLVNSLYGIMAYPTFRLYNNIIASTITFLSRDLLQYVENKMKEMNYEVIYTDTDSLMYKAKKDEIDLLNNLVRDWAIEKYEKPDININFESEGMFTKLLILGKCHYFGYLKDNSVPEIKGMEIKRSNSSKYEAWFQQELIERILSKKPKEQILNWIKQEKDRIKTLPLKEISFPAKIANREYKNIPIFVRAYNNSKKLFSNFKPNKGEIFYYIFINYSNYRVLAFINNYQNIKKEYIDWDEVIRRNILLKADTIFKVLNWGDIKLLLSDQLSLF